MTKAVFTTKVDPTYDDLPEYRYHFPRTYFRQVEASVGDWIVYYEPRRTSGELSSRGGRQAYFATARVTAIEADPRQSDHFYAFVTDFLEFDRAVPFKDGAHYYEKALQRADGQTSKGAFGRAVRPLPDDEYNLIVLAGLAQMATFVNVTSGSAFNLGEELAEFARPVVEQITHRPFRDAAFAAAVKAAYDHTCAVTGLKIITSDGLSEAQAAHIRPVAECGPDSVHNGIALCGTVHWMFDRGLISFTDDHSILVTPDYVPNEVLRLIQPSGKLRVPARPDTQPHPHFLKYHRERIFKGRPT